MKRQMADRTFLVSRVFRSGIQAVLPATSKFVHRGCLSNDAERGEATRIVCSGRRCRSSFQKLIVNRRNLAIDGILLSRNQQLVESTLLLVIDCREPFGHVFG